MQVGFNPVQQPQMAQRIEQIQNKQQISFGAISSNGLKRTVGPNKFKSIIEQLLKGTVYGSLRDSVKQITEAAKKLDGKSKPAVLSDAVKQLNEVIHNHSGIYRYSDRNHINYAKLAVVEGCNKPPHIDFLNPRHNYLRQDHDVFGYGLETVHIDVQDNKAFKVSHKTGTQDIHSDVKAAKITIGGIDLYKEIVKRFPQLEIDCNNPFLMLSGVKETRVPDKSGKAHQRMITSLITRMNENFYSRAIQDHAKLQTDIRSVTNGILEAIEKKAAMSKVSPEDISKHHSGKNIGDAVEAFVNPKTQ